MNWNDPEQVREYYRRYRAAHPGYGAAKMAAYRKGRSGRHIVASDFKYGPLKAQRIDWGTLEAI